jgi:Mn-dependent DtxR family transcriptional regulator
MNEQRQKAVMLLIDHHAVTIQEISDELNLSRVEASETVYELKQRGLIQRSKIRACNLFDKTIKVTEAYWEPVR